MLRLKKQLLFVLFMLPLIFGGKAQTTFNAIINSNLYTSENSIVNGIAWTNSVSYQGNRFCGSSNWKSGSVTFNGRVYSELKINYDLLNDELILYVETPGSEKYIQLNKRLIERFRYIDANETKTFIYKEIDPSKGKEIYEEVYKGTTSFYIKHKKAIRKEIGTVYMGKLYDQNTFYLHYEEETYSFKNKKKVLQILGNSKELKNFIRNNNLRIHKKYPQDIVRLLKYHQSLTKANGL